MTKERFIQLWKTLVEDRPGVEQAEELLPSNGVSNQLKKALLEKSSDDGSCLALLVPED